jgi:hypothetical protein
MDVEISPYVLEPTKLFEGVIQENDLMIEIPSEPNDFLLVSADVQLIQPELTDNTSVEFLPMMDSISDSSFNSDPEYIDCIMEIDGGRKRNKVNKKKQKKIINNNLTNEWTVKCIHKDKIKDTVCNVSILSSDEIS